MDQQLLDLVIRNRTGVALKIPVKTITSYNSTGKFDILPFHSNFITLVEKTVLYVDQNNKAGEYKIDKALMKVSSNKVRVYLTI